MITLRRPRLTYPNDHHLARLRAYTRQAGLEIVDDHRRRFALPLPDHQTAERVVASSTFAAYTRRAPPVPPGGPHSGSRAPS